MCALRIPAFRGVPPYAKDINRLIASRIPTGRVIYQTSFEEGLDGFWTMDYTGSSGTRYTGYLCRNFKYAHTGKASLEMLVRGVAGVTTAQILGKTLAYPFKGERKIGLELYFMLSTPWKESVTERIYLQLSRWTGSNQIYAELIIYPQHNVLNYRNSGGGETTIADPFTFPNASIDDLREESFVNWNYPGSWLPWNYIKIEADFANEKYGKIWCNNQVFDVAEGEDLRTLSNARQKNMIDMQLIGEQKTANDRKLFIDDVIFTVEED